jgi:TolA-binding protein
MTVRRIVLALGLVPLLGASARADSVDDAGQKLIELESRLAELDRNLKPPEDPKGQLAERRLIDAEVAYELKNYEAASIILYDLIEKYPNSRVYPEALYYLSDSLYLKRDYFSSRRYFEKLVELGPSSGKYQEALQRLIELSLHTGDYSPVDGYLQKLAQLPISEQKPSIPYVKGKYLYFRRDFQGAIDTLRPLPTNHKYYLYGQYFIGAASVAMGPERLQDALTAFDNIVKIDEAQEAAVKAATGKDGKPLDPKAPQPPRMSDAEKIIVELAHMGRARILLDQGQLTAALQAYSRIKSKSANFNDALYESAWVSIKGKEYQKAAQQLDLLLLNSPESSLAPETRLLSGNLHIRQGQYNSATSSFTKTRDEYEPVSKDLAAEAQKQTATSSYFKDLITKNLSSFDTGKIVPAAAARWIKEEISVKKLSELIIDEGDLAKSLAECEETIKRLERAVNGPGRVNIFTDLARARTKGVEISNQVTEVRRTVSDRERQLIEPVAGPEDAQLKGIAAERAALEEQMKALPTKEQSIQERQQKAREAFNELDKRGSEIQVVIHGVRAQVVATNQFYRNQVAKTLPVQQQQLAQAELDQYVAELEGEQAALDALRREIQETQQNVGADDSDMKAAEELKVKYNDVVSRQHALVQRVSSRLSGGDKSKLDQIENILQRGRALEEKLVAYNRRIDALVEEKLGPIRATIDEEKNRVLGYRTTLAGYQGESADVGGDVMADGLRHVADRFYNIVVRADVGIIDVAWALKDASSKETSRLVSERKRELKLLDDEFKQVLKEAQ